MKLRLLTILVIMLCAVVGAANAPAATTSGTCTYKMTNFAIYLDVTGAAARMACDEIGRAAKGSVVRIYTRVRGSARCAFENYSIDAKTTLYSPSLLYGTYACELLAKPLRKQGWVRLF